MDRIHRAVNRFSPIHHSLVMTRPAAMPTDHAPIDEELIRAIIEDGSDTAFRALYRRHNPRVFRLALRLLANQADAEDVTQEAWVRAMQRLDSYQGNSLLGTWLCGFVVNVAREQLSRRREWSEWEDDIADATVADPTARMDIERAMATLPARCRAVFLLHDVEGFTHEEIAEQLGCTAGTSKTQLFRARRVLRRVLAEEPDTQRIVSP